MGAHLPLKMNVLIITIAILLIALPICLPYALKQKYVVILWIIAILLSFSSLVYSKCVDYNSSLRGIEKGYFLEIGSIMIFVDNTRISIGCICYGFVGLLLGLVISRFVTTNLKG